MKSKLLLLILSIAVTVATLFSCEFPSLTPPPSEGSEYSRLVYADSDLHLLDVRSTLEDIVGIVSVTPDSEAAVDGEIVFGDTNRPVTALAKAALEKELAKTADYDAGYIIYSDGKNIAVYWTLDGMELIAVPKLISEFLSDDKIEIKEGIAFTDFYKEDEFERDKAWAVIEAEADPGVVSALKALHGYFDGAKLAGWAANLYDPEIGGFYYSISARDNEPFRPDLESTYQLFGFMVSNGAFKDRNVAIPEDIKAKIVAFVKSTQSKVDGYFYHPQWPQGRENLNTDRYGRDLQWALSLLDSFTLDTNADGVQEKQYPEYCILSTKCEKHYNTKEKCQFPIADAEAVTAAVSGTRNITGLLGGDISSAVYKMTSSASVVATAVSSRPDYSSREAFAAWLELYNDPEEVKENSGKAHNLAALKTEIVGHGMADIVLDQIDRIQEELFEEQRLNKEEPTGMWQRTADYKAVWGLLKYTSFYNDGATGRQINPKFVPYIVKTCIKVIESPPSDDYHMNDLYNQWVGITNLINNVKKWNKGTEQVIYEILRENTESLIDTSLLKIEPFKISDGSIGYSTTGRSYGTMYGVPISRGVVEGDVNAAHLCCAMYRSVFTCLGYNPVPIFTEADGKAFVETLIKSEPITKNENKIETIDFENGIPVSLSYQSGTISTNHGLAQDPADPFNMAYYYESPAVDLGGKGATVSFAPTVAGDGCYIFEAGIYVQACHDNTYLLQIYLGDAYLITIHKDGDNVIIRETPSDKQGKHYDVATVKMKEWFKLRVEYYTPEAVGEGSTVPKIKLYVNDKYIRTSECFAGSQAAGAAPINTYDTVRFYSLRGASTEIYLDDCFFSKETKTYSANDHSITDARDD